MMTDDEYDEQFCFPPRRGKTPVRLERVVRGTTYKNHKMKTGTELIAEERARQIKSEGWTAEHDDSHDKQEMLRAAVCYAMHEVDNSGYANAAIDEWPWSMDWYKPSAEPIRNLVKAGALIAAEIDRLQRASNAGAQRPPAEKSEL